MMNEFYMLSGRMLAMLNEMKKNIARNAENASDAWEKAYNLVKLVEMDDSPVTDEEASEVYAENAKCAEAYTVEADNLRRINIMISLMEDIISESDMLEGV